MNASWKRSRVVLSIRLIASFVAAIESNLTLQTFASQEWRPPILKTIATNGAGVQALVDTIWRFRSQTGLAQAARRQRRGELRLRELVAQRFMDRLERGVLMPGELEAMVDRVAGREIDPYTAADELVSRAVRPPDHQVTKAPRS